MMVLAVKRYAGIILLLLLLLSCASAYCVLWAGKPVFSATGRPERVYILDAGHGGEDGGALSAKGDRESDINLAIVRDLDSLLCFLGKKTLLTRREDVSVHSGDAVTIRQKKASDLRNRAALVNATPGGILISVHQNSLPSVPSVHGAQVFFGGAEDSEELAASVQAALNQTVNRGNPKREKRIDSSVYLMKTVTRTAILAECGFMTNAAEAEKLRDASYQRALAVVLASGILRAGAEETERGELA